jgi:hypothetical protein
MEFPNRIFFLWIYNCVFQQKRILLWLKNREKKLSNDCWISFEIFQHLVIQGLEFPKRIFFLWIYNWMFQQKQNLLWLKNREKNLSNDCWFSFEIFQCLVIQVTKLLFTEPKLNQNSCNRCFLSTLICF